MEPFAAKNIYKIRWDYKKNTKKIKTYKLTITQNVISNSLMKKSSTQRTNSTPAPDELVICFWHNSSSYSSSYAVFP